MNLVKFSYHIIRNKKLFFGLAALLAIFLVIYLNRLSAPTELVEDSLKTTPVSINIYLTDDNSQKFQNQYVLAYFDIYLHKAADLYLVDVAPEFIGDIALNDYKLYYDFNFDQQLDSNDKPVENYLDVILSGDQEIGKGGKQYENKLKLARYRFYLISQKLSSTDFSGSLKSIKFGMEDVATGKKIKNKDINERIINKSSFKYFDLISDINKFKVLNPYFLVNEKNKEIVLPAGNYNIGRTIIIPSGYTLKIQPGSTLIFSPKTSLVSYSNIIAQGNPSAPINFMAGGKEPWGVLAVLNTDKQSIFDYCKFSSGKDDYINGVYFSGMLSIYHSKVKISDSRFSNAKADDSLNIKYSSAELSQNTFSDNAADGIDFDFIKEGFIKQSEFYNNGNDAIDLSGSTILIENNYIEGSGDKGISVGEKSLGTLIYNNILNGCNIGVEIKDLSDIKIINNVIINNKIGLNAYQKKPVFGGGKAEVYNSILWQNELDIQMDEKSKINIYYSNIKDANGQNNNFNYEPVFTNPVLKDYSIDLKKSDKQFAQGGNNEILVKELKIELPQAPVGLNNYLK
ncbi:MAG: right-handed parallel beta-helix repeat-containing protein [Patescibacteria group bacterium]|nr:right-handed parallel beta-helix repeat-containing protein [Patescibacteria group bacterium]